MAVENDTSACACYAVDKKCNRRKQTGNADAEVFTLSAWSADVERGGLIDTNQTETVTLSRELARISHHELQIVAYRAANIFYQ